jgi:RNA polymerase sigma-70 factor (ECF subfamily)
MDEDVAVIERVLAGDIAAFRILVERHEQRVFGFARRFLRRAADCEDVAQEVFLSAYRNLASYRADTARFSTWLLALARNKCLNLLNKRSPAALGGDVTIPEPIDPRTPEAALAEAEFHAQLDTCLAALPLEQKTAFVLAELHELSLAEIGNIEGVSVGTVKSRLGRARSKLREQWLARAKT